MINYVKKIFFLFFFFIALTITILKIINPPSFISTNFRLIIFISPEIFIIILFFLYFFVKKEFYKFLLSFSYVGLIFFYLIDYSFHTISTNSNKTEELKILANNNNIKFDNRNIYEMFVEAKKKNIDTILSISPANWLKNNEFYPLSSKSLSNVLYCNENGYYVEYLSDRYGFRNKDTKWDTKLDFVIIGDSFVQGGCVEDSKNISGLMTNNKLSNINLGWGGTSILIQYAILREYLNSINSNNVVLFFYPKNDIIEYRSEIKNPILNNYLINDNYSQGLITIQSKVDSYIDEHIILWEKNYKNLSKNYFYHMNFTFDLITKILKTKLEKTSEHDYFNILKKFKYFLDRKYITIQVVCIPSYYDFLNKDIINNSCTKYQHHFDNLQIKYINSFEEISNKSLEEMFPFGYNAHFSPNGYELFVNSFIEKLQ